MSPWFRTELRSSSGVFVPPSYVTGIPARVFRVLGFLDRIVCGIPVFGYWADHRVLILRRV